MRIGIDTSESDQPDGLRHPGRAAIDETVSCRDERRGRRACPMNFAGT